MNFHNAIASLWAIWLVYWIVSAFGNKRAAQTSRVWRIMTLLVLVGMITLWQNFPAFCDQRFFPRTFAGALTGTILCALGLAFSIWARAVLGRNWSSNPSIKEGHELVQSGPYRLARHPIYTGLLLAILGTSIAGGKNGDLILLLAMTVMLTIKLRIEESLMQRQFAEQYTEYRKRTKALIPFVL